MNFWVFLNYFLLSGTYLSTNSASMNYIPGPCPGFLISGLSLCLTLSTLLLPSSDLTKVVSYWYHRVTILTTQFLGCWVVVDSVLAWYHFQSLTLSGYSISFRYPLELCIQLDISFPFSLAFFASLSSSAVCKVSSDNHFAFLHFFFFGCFWSLPPAQGYKPLSIAFMHSVYQI